MRMSFFLYTLYQVKECRYIYIFDDDIIRGFMCASVESERRNLRRFNDEDESLKKVLMQTQNKCYIFECSALSDYQESKKKSTGTNNLKMINVPELFPNSDRLSAHRSLSTGGRVEPSSRRFLQLNTHTQ